MEISNKFDAIEHSYIAEKLASWRGDLDYVYHLATEYAKTAEPACLDTLFMALRSLANPDTAIQRELRYIEEKRAKFEAKQVSA